MRRDRGKIKKRIMAIVLSVAMTMSNMTVFASEASPDIGEEIQTVVDESTEPDKEPGSVETGGETESSPAGSEEESGESTVNESQTSTGESQDSSEDASVTETESESVTKTEDQTQTESETETETETQTETETEAEETLERNADYSGNLYVSPDGKSDGDGTNDSPLDLETAILNIQPGKSIIMLDGTYSFSSRIVIESNNSGTSGNMKTIKADENAEVVLDFSAMADNDSNYGVVLDGDYWHFYGITIKGAGDNGMLLSGNDNLIEMCVFTENRDAGLQIARFKSSAATKADWPSNNTVKNCTSFLNYDNVGGNKDGEDADGFAAKITCGEGNVFDGCIAYSNSDDGWDLYSKYENTNSNIGVVTIKNCIAFNNGFMFDGNDSVAGDGNGFKLGGSANADPSLDATAHIVVNCLSFNNAMHGFTDNENLGAIVLKNCTAFNNGVDTDKAYSNFAMDRTRGGVNIKLLSLNFSGRSIGADKFYGAVDGSVLYKNGKNYSLTKPESMAGTAFTTGTEITLTASDFVSTSIPGADSNVHKNLRNGDGSIKLGDFLKVSDSSSHKELLGALGYKAEGLPESEYTGNLTIEGVTPPSDDAEPAQTDKIDVYDFGAEQLDSSVYNNRLSVDIINGWYDSSDANIKVGQADSANNYVNKDAIVTDGDKEVFKIHSASTKKIRVYTDNSDVTRQQTKNLKSIDENTTYHGAIACNGTQNIDNFYFEFDLTAGDIVTAYVSTDSNPMTYKFVQVDDADNFQTFAYTSDSNHADKAVFYVTKTGKYRLGQDGSSGKFKVARVYVEHPADITVSGNVTAPSALTDYSVTFENQITKEVKTASVTNGQYSITLQNKYKYKVGISENGYVVTDGKDMLDLTSYTSASKTHDITVKSVELVDVSGSFTGISADELAKIDIALENSESVYVPELTINGTNYSTKLEKGVVYTVKAADKEEQYAVDDYTLTTTTISATAAATDKNIVFTPKATHKVTINITGVDAAGKEIIEKGNYTFSYLDLEIEDIDKRNGYVYTFEGADSIALRDGTYQIDVNGTGLYVQKRTANLVVNGADVTANIGFTKEERTEWDFENDSSLHGAANGVQIQSKTGSFRGLEIDASTGKFDTLNRANDAQINNTTKVKIPVTGPCEVLVKLKTNAYTLAGEAAAAADTKYKYSGEAGYVELVATANTYLLSIKVTYTTDYKEKITVGAADCDFTTINDALDVIRKMERTDGQRVTIEIQPGDYEEMLVVDVPNVTLKNAAANPSVQLKNKGVDIDESAVRITWYYGHGYSYYSMGSDYKYDAELLEVNKVNGYPSTVNPGAGTATMWNASVIIDADGFEADGIIFENSFNQYISKKCAEDGLVKKSDAKEGSTPRANLKTAGDTKVQEKAYVERATALAIKNNHENIFFNNCSFVGRQDVVYGGTGVTAGFYGCDVYGAVDYIFGGMTAVFAKCDLYLNTSDTSGDVAYITAPQQQAYKDGSGAQQSAAHGYLMYNCHVKSITPGVDSASVHPSKPSGLGRAWSANTGEAVFYKTIIDATDEYWYDSEGASLIAPAGWYSGLSTGSSLCTEYGTFEYAVGIDNSSKRDTKNGGGVLTDEKLASGEAISVATFLGSWNPFDGKDMSVTMPAESDRVFNASKPEVKLTFDEISEETGLGAVTVGWTKANWAKTIEITYKETDKEAKTVTLDETELGKLSQTEYQLTDLTADMTYEVTVKAYLTADLFKTSDTKTIVVEQPSEDELRTYRFDATTLTAAADNEEIAAGTVFDKFFKVFTGKADNADQLVKKRTSKSSGKVTSAEIGKWSAAGFEFTLTKPASVSMSVSSTGGSNSSAIALVDETGIAMDNNEGLAVVTGTAATTLTYAKIPAGTYRIVSPQTENMNRGVRIITIEVAELAEGVVTKEYILDASSDLAAFNAGDKKDGDTQKAGTNEFFTVIYSAKSKVDASGKTFSDGFKGTQRINFGGKASTSKNAVKFDITGTAKVKVWWVEGGDDSRQIVILDEMGTEVTKTSETNLVKNNPYISELEISKAGTYYLGGDINNNLIFKIQVTETTTGGGDEEPRNDWSEVAAPEITDVSFVENADGSEDKSQVAITVKMVMGTNGADALKVNVYKGDAAEAETVTSSTKLDESTFVYVYKPSATGTYSFEAVASRRGETGKDKLSAKKTLDFTLPLAAPVISGLTSLGEQADGTVSVSFDWSEVKETDKYIVTYWERKGDETVSETRPTNEQTIEVTDIAARSMTLTGLKAKVHYFITVTAVRGDETAVSKTAYVYTLVKALDTYTLSSEDYERFAAGAMEDGQSVTGGANDFFTIRYSAKSKLDGSNKTWSDGYKGTQRFNFGGTMETEKNVIEFTTTDQAVVSVWWACGSAGRGLTLINEEGIGDTSTLDTVANQAYITKFKLNEAGKYYLGNTVGNNYIFKVVVEIGEQAPEIRERWNVVAPPAITKVVQGTAKQDDVTVGTMEVTVAMQMGIDGADALTVDMIDSEGNLVESVEKTVADVSTVTVSLTPQASGQYTFQATATREGEEEAKVSNVSDPYDFKLLLGAPTFKSATCKGGGAIELEWSSVKEADSYILSVMDTDIKIETEKLKHKITEGLEIGKEYTFEVRAVRGKGDTKEISEGVGTITETVKDENMRTWSFSAYGSSVNEKNNGFEGSVADGKVTVYSESGKGKIVPASTDGLAFYYTAIDPEKENFTLTATITVDNWTLSNGQEGMGLMVSDTVGEPYDSTTLWNNSFQNLATKVEYRYDGEHVTTDDNYPKISMKLGLGTIAKTGATAEGVEAVKAGMATLPEGFKHEYDNTTLETSCARLGAGTYNILGNYVPADKAPTGTQADKLLTTFKLQIQRNNTGYWLRYLDLNGKVLGEKLYYDLDRNELTKLDPENIYVGFVASRNARITATDIDFVTINPADDAPAEERETVYLTPSCSIASASVSNTEEYELLFTANWNGHVTVRDDANVKVIDADYKVSTAAEDKDKKSYLKENVKLDIGVNNFKVTFTPDKAYQPNDYTELTSYDAQVLTHNVNFRKYGAEGETLYVAVDGTASGNGTKDNPLDIYTAVKWVQPGQTIIIQEGTYKLTNTIKVERGINGTADKRIYMIADPDAATRPVFDFQKRCMGMSLAGDYWYFKGFDVTNSADALNGIKVSGSYNTLDRIQTYRNGNTGLQIGRLLVADGWDEWPAHNLILNCSSYLNSDLGYEDADGFAAKLTIGDGNVFDGCIACYNADDGWDLFAKVQSGTIGAVTIRNSIAFKNGYILDENGNEINAGNGNGFKMGGDSLKGGHIVENSLAFANKAKGIDSNSCPDIKAYNSISFDNESYNVAMYTNTATQTNYEAKGIVSYKKSNKITEQLVFKGDQAVRDSDLYKAVYNGTNYFFNGISSVNTEKVKVTDDWFVSLDTAKALAEGGITRKADGTIDMHGYLELTENAKADAALGGTKSEEVVPGTETDGDIAKGDDTDSSSSGILPGDMPEDGVVPTGLWIADIKEVVYTGQESSEIKYTGKAVKPDVHVYVGATLLTEGSDYTIKFKNNTAAYVRGAEQFKDVPETKVPVVMVTGKGKYIGTYTKTFDINPVDLGSDKGISAPATAVLSNGRAQKPKPVMTLNGKKLSNKDYAYDTSITFTEPGVYDVVLTAKSTNFTGSRTTQFVIVDKNDANAVLMSKASVNKIANQVYTGADIKPSIGEVKYKGNVLNSEYYTVEYYSNKDIGTATVEVVGDNVHCFGTKTITFKIVGGNLKDASVSASFSNGIVKKPLGTAGNEIDYAGQAVKLTSTMISMGEGETAVQLKPNRDYTLTYKNNDKAGTATVTFKGINNYSGTVSRTIKINAYDLSTANVNEVVRDVNNGKLQTPVYYEKNGSTPTISLSVNSNKLKQGKDYILSYSNNKMAKTAGETNPPTITIKGKNGFKGSLKVAYTIQPTVMTDPEAGIVATANDVVYKAVNTNYKTKIVVTDDGKVLSPSTDYDAKRIEYEYKTTGTDGSVQTVTFKEGDRLSAPIPAGTEVTVKIYASARSVNYVNAEAGALTTTYRIVERGDIAKASVKALNPKYISQASNFRELSTNDFYYTDKAGLTVSRVTLGGKELFCNTDFVIDKTTYVGTGKVGTAKVTIRGIGNYGGQKVITYKINKMNWSIDKAEVLPIYVQYTDAVEGAVLDADILKGKILLNNEELELGKDYEIAIDAKTGKPSYKNNLKAGKTASVIIKGIGSYGGQKTIKYKVVESNDIAYADFVPFDKKVVAKEALSGGVQLTEEDFWYVEGQSTRTSRISLWGKELEYDKDFIVRSYANNKKAGRATVTLTGAGSYEGTLKLVYEIVLQEEN
ncbi:MAG: fibronectin type III domain-containing protein [Lachnospiraceae bacterium]|nr:fibronectin type III domain-containing protein [Lachnospiraceae bacterium]